MRGGMDPNYGLTALVIVAVVALVALVVVLRSGSDARVELERSDRTGSIRMRGSIEAPRHDPGEPKALEPKSVEPKVVAPPSRASR